MFVSKYISLHFFVNTQNEIKMLYLFWKQLLLVPRSGRIVNLNIAARINVIIQAESLLKTSPGRLRAIARCLLGYKIPTKYIILFRCVIYL